jgi:hypothetical protein
MVPRVGIDKIQCSLDEAFTSRISPIVYDQLKKGTRTVTVRAIDTAGNIGDDQFTWTVNPAEAAKLSRTANEICTLLSRSP